ncbi:MAG TPA: choice-of-anchor D domain-containing protein [Myxococcota bacterium]|nr:choice-of-anchor D domain-containing protein [Myxococcota bacterium]
MYNLKTHAALIAIVTLLLALGCQDDKLHGSAPEIDRFHFGPADSPPILDDYTPLPDSDEIVIDFGLVDVMSISRRYLFIRNEGQGDLILSALEISAGSSPDFLLGCRKGGIFENGCPYSQEHPLSIAPGRDLAVEITYAPGEVGPDSGDFVMTFNTSLHRTISVHLIGQSVTREIQVCISDCVGDEQSAGCQQAAEICNGDVGKDNLVVAFGDTAIGSVVERTISVRNLGERGLQVSVVNLAAGSGAQFALDTSTSGLPGEIATGDGTQFIALYTPDGGQEHLGRVRIISDDPTAPQLEVELVGQGVAPRVCPEPAVLDFGTVATGQAVVKSFTINNCGLMPLEVYQVAMAANPYSPDFSLVDPGSVPGTLGVGESVDVQVQYLPPTDGSDAGGVDIFSNDMVSDPVSHLTGTVALFGRAISQVCDLQVVPFVGSFGVVEIGAPATVDLLVSNAGNGPCTLSDSDISANTPDGEFSVVSEPAADTVIDPGPGNEVTLSVGYDPIDRGQDTGTLSLYVNDKDTDEVRVDLNAFGNWPGGDGPIAICSVDPQTTVPLTTVRWLGNQSYDTNNRPIAVYRWSIVAFPAGSAATLVGIGANRSTQVDLAGSYTAQLVVENDIGQVSEPCTATTSVTPTQDLWIEMYWTHAGDDMDLHLLAPGGTPRTSSDCFFSNCVGMFFTPDWGQLGYDGDDPHLDQDDIPHTGAENISIADPADGVYTVFVNDYPGSVYDPPNKVYVNVYIDGALVAGFDKDISGENVDWYVCEIDWPSGVITPL